ncbi:MAG: hypothetical protein Q7R47_05190, partial [Candidatus Diapherotrites archaeon]|nr:hypothetical protein [Candidatus Diapherotrites archaeon]
AGTSAVFTELIELLSKSAPEYKGVYEVSLDISGLGPVAPTKNIYYFKNGSARFDLINPSIDNNVPLQRIFYTPTNTITCINQVTGSYLDGTAKIGATEKCFSEPSASSNKASIGNLETPYQINSYKTNQDSITVYSLGKKTFTDIEANCYRLERLSGETKVTNDYCINKEGIITFRRETRKLNNLNSITTLKLITIERTVPNETMTPPPQTQ